LRELMCPIVPSFHEVFSLVWRNCGFIAAEIGAAAAAERAAEAVCQGREAAVGGAG
jgi:hypothetical protein